MYKQEAEGLRAYVRIAAASIIGKSETRRLRTAVETNCEKGGSEELTRGKISFLVDFHQP